MKPTVLQTLSLCAALGLGAAASAAPTLVQNVRVFDRSTLGAANRTEACHMARDAAWL